MFTIEDAVGQLKIDDPSRSDVEKSMDEFFMTHLPKQVIQGVEDTQDDRLDEDAIRVEIRAPRPFKKSQTQVQPVIDPQESRDIGTPLNSPPVRRRTSDLTFAFTNSRERLKKLSMNSQKSEIGQKIIKMRIAANSDRQQSFMAPESNLQNETLKRWESTASLPMSPSTFKKKFCDDMFNNPSKLMEVRNIIGPTTTNTYSKSRFAPPAEDSPPIHMFPLVEETDEWSTPGKSVSPYPDSSRS